jgi:hypothetical protein
VRWLTELQGDPDRRRRVVSGALAMALAAHDLEEAIGFQRQHAEILRVVPFAPSVAAAWIALAGVTAAGLLLLLWAGAGPSTPARRLALRATALVLLANVMIPHLPAAWILGGYAPGVLTAVLINLPVCGLALWALRNDR